MTNYILEINGIYKTIKKNEILKNINFKVKKGEILGIIGKSGVGKTTLLKILVGFTKADKGLIYLNSKNITTKMEILQSKVGFLTQENSFYDELTVSENLFYFGKIYNVPLKNIKISSKNILNFLNLYSHKDKLSLNLSGGMKRRLDFACAMIHNPEIIILDEPTTGMDPILRKQFWNYIKYINKKLGKTIIFSSHHLDELENLCDSVMIIENGKIKEFGHVDEIKEKYEKNYEMHLRTEPGNYNLILKKFKEDKINIKKFTIHQNTLLLFTTKPHHTLRELIPILDNINENLIEVDLKRPTLNEIFEFYMEVNKK